MSMKHFLTGVYAKNFFTNESSFGKSVQDVAISNDPPSAPSDPLADSFLEPERKKYILTGLARDHLIARGLAFWFMDDHGLACKGRFTTNVHTQEFQPNEIQRLCQELSEKFGFNCCSKKNKKRVLYCDFRQKLSDTSGTDFFVGHPINTI